MFWKQSTCTLTVCYSISYVHVFYDFAGTMIAPRKLAVLLAGYIIRSLQMGTFKSFGVFYLLIQENLDTTNIVLGAWMASYEVATVIFGKILIRKKQNKQPNKKPF